MKKNKLANSDFKTFLSKNYTTPQSERYMTVIGNNRKTKLQLDLEAHVGPKEYENDALNTVINIDDSQLWFIYQNNLFQLDLKKEKVLRPLYLSHRRPHQVILDRRTILAYFKK